MMAVVKGTMVETARRCWPGSNKPGGIAKVTALNYSPTGVLESVDVYYPVEGNRERKVPLQFVKPKQSSFLTSAAEHGMKVSINKRCKTYRISSHRF